MAAGPLARVSGQIEQHHRDAGVGQMGGNADPHGSRAQHGGVLNHRAGADQEQWVRPKLRRRVPWEEQARSSWFWFLLHSNGTLLDTIAKNRKREYGVKNPVTSITRYRYCKCLMVMPAVLSATLGGWRNPCSGL